MKEFIDNFLREETEPLNILPKKANIDLKRYLKPKMDKLNKRTEKAIVKILSKINIIIYFINKIYIIYIL